MTKKIFIYQIVVFFLVVGISVLSYQNWQLRQHLEGGGSRGPDSVPALQDAPYYKEIMDIIRPLDYSVIPSLVLQSNIKLSIDFTNKTWSLLNFHQFDSNGNIILDYGRYGLCGELASYTYNRIKYFFNDRYVIKFAQVSESGFFLTPNSSHAVLIIYDTVQSKGYLLDPTFHRYGPIENYHDYLYSSYGEKIQGIDKKETAVTFNMNHGEPIIIRNNFISMLTVQDYDGKFDKNNFILAIMANHRYDYTGRCIFALQNHNGHTEIIEDKLFENEALPPEDISLLRKTLFAWFYSLGK